MYTGEKAKAYTTGFHDGYQEAIADVAAAYERGGADDAMTWVRENLIVAIKSGEITSVKDIGERTS